MKQKKSNAYLYQVIKKMKEEQKNLKLEVQLDDFKGIVPLSK